MQRIASIDHAGGWTRDDTMRAERLRHRRARSAWRLRAGLLRLCAPVPTGQERCCAAR